MHAVILTIHLLLALALILVVLLQRSEGGGLGIGGGGGGIMTSRGAATALSKVTWVLGIAFVVTSLTLTILAARDAGTGSVVDARACRRRPAPPARRRCRVSAATCCRQLPAEPAPGRRPDAPPPTPATPAATDRPPRRRCSERGNFWLPVAVIYSILRGDALPPAGVPV